jgi:intron-binding protein aquarius
MRCRYATSDGFALGNLPHVDLKSDVCKEQFTLRNPGFLYPFQFINVPGLYLSLQSHSQTWLICLDFQGSGESSPTPNSYQNVGEAEYIVALYQYMRLLGYPANKITILTTYSAQRQLISEIIAQRCKKAYFGKNLKKIYLNIHAFSSSVL